MKRADQFIHPHNWHDRYRAAMSFGEHVADLVSNFVGSWLFVIIHSIWFAIWIAVGFEPFPYGLLTLIVSLEAIFLATFVMMSQNRGADRDRHNAEADYETNKAAKIEIEEIILRLGQIEEEKLDVIISMLKK